MLREPAQGSVIRRKGGPSYLHNINTTHDTMVSSSPVMTVCHGISPCLNRNIASCPETRQSGCTKHVPCFWDDEALCAIAVWRHLNGFRGQRIRSSTHLDRAEMIDSIAYGRTRICIQITIQPQAVSLIHFSFFRYFPHLICSCFMCDY